jgi:hypothetical protein
MFLFYFVGLLISAVMFGHQLDKHVNGAPLPGVGLVIYGLMAVAFMHAVLSSVLLIPVEP